MIITDLEFALVMNWVLDILVIAMVVNLYLSKADRPE